MHYTQRFTLKLHQMEPGSPTAEVRWYHGQGGINNLRRWKRKIVHYIIRAPFEVWEVFVNMIFLPSFIQFKHTGGGTHTLCKHKSVFLFKEKWRLKILTVHFYNESNQMRPNTYFTAIKFYSSSAVTIQFAQSPSIYAGNAYGKTISGATVPVLPTKVSI